VWFLTRQGVDDHTAMAFGLLWFAVILAASAVGGAVYWWSGAAVPGLRGRPADQAAGEEAQLPSES
jgi:hypothetical protein